MCTPLRRVTSCLLLALSVIAVIVLDPTATPPSRLWYEELARLRRQVDKLPSDFEKTTFLREYVGGLIDLGELDDRSRSLYQSLTLVSFDPAQFYPKFRGHTLAAECGITTFFYIKLLQAFGFKAYQYSFGFTKPPYERYIHSIVLVDISFEGARRLIIQDPYLDLTYRDSRNSPVDFFDFLSALKRKGFGQIAMDASSVTTSLLVPDPESYYLHLNDTCRTLMRGALRRADGSLRPRIAILRSYPTLMQSACGSYEAGFLEAMRSHGLDEPFLYSYTLPATDVAGSPDQDEVQARIDAVLGKRPTVASKR